MRDRERHEKRVGTVVDGRWRVDGLLGWGSTSAVYAATHRNGHRAALKILHQSLCSDALMAERFLREAGIANAIKHRAIVPICDDGMTAEGCAYLVVELLEGDTLQALRERTRGRIELEELAPIADELMSALSAVHAAGVVHRDLKPQNVFITASGELKLLDFGTARIFDRAAGSSVSAAGMVLGTPAFMSPEQARGARAEVDAQSDVWSLGAMIFTILSGEYVHGPSRDSHTRLLAAASQHARKLGDVAPSIDDRVATVVDRALAHAKEDRWPDVRSMRVAFRHAVEATVPTLRDLEAFGDGAAEEEVATGTVSMSEPTLAIASASAATGAIATPMAAVVPLDVCAAPASESEMLGVSSTQAVRRVKAGIPVPALFAGFGVMAAVVFLIMFFVSAGDEPSVRSAAAQRPGEPSPPPAQPTTVAAPAASFIVIEAPDEPLPAAVTKKKESLPAWATAPVPKVPPPPNAPRSDAGTVEPPAAAAEPGVGRANEGMAGEDTKEGPDPKGGTAPSAAPVELP